MVRKITLAVSLGAGYLLGAKAGEERYDQIQGKVRALLSQPAVQQFTGSTAASAGGTAGQAPGAVTDPVSATSDLGSSAGANPIDVGPSGVPASSSSSTAIEDMSELELATRPSPAPPSPPVRSSDDTPGPSS